MAAPLLTERVMDLRRFRLVKNAGSRLPLLLENLAHVYVKLDFKNDFENATSADTAKGFLSSVARASKAAEMVAQMHSGFLLEVQGSMLHVGLQPQSGRKLIDCAMEFARDLHWILRAVFHDQQKRVQGWRMSGDQGKTLVVAGRGVHDDDSFVSLGRSANRPAKHLYAELAIPNESRRRLKRFHFAIRRPSSITGQDAWDHFNLDKTSPPFTDLDTIAEEARLTEPNVTLFASATGWKQTKAEALPLAPAGHPASPTPNEPNISFGWVMRADLDGFTKRVEACFDDNEQLAELAGQFYCLMDAAADFTERHRETLAQLPWAGDNFTAAAVFRSRADFDAAIPKRLIELTLDFERDLADAATECGFTGWAHVVACGEPHGNASGNIYLAGVEIDGRRFLVGVGEGFGRSASGFGDINPRASEIVTFNPDWERLDESFKRAFEPATTVDGVQSTLYRIASVSGLQKIRLRQAVASVSTAVGYPGGQTRSVPTRPHSE